MPRQNATALAGRTLDQRAVDRVATLHERFLRGRGGRRALLRFAEAPGLDWRRRLLDEADFTGANLEGALFAGSHLERASLHCANLQNCDLRATSLRRADLRGARLAGAALNGAVMDGADMRAAYLVHADADGSLRLVRHEADSASGWGGNSFGADFTNCAMRGVRLCAANLKGANFSGAVLDSADFTGAKLVDALFSDTVLTGAVLERVSLSPQQWDGCVLEPSPTARARAPEILARLTSAAKWVETGGRSGATVVVDREDLRPLATAFRGRLLTALTARGARAIGLDWSGSQLQGAVFDDADLRGAIFDGADLRGASFKNTRLSHARFVGADLRPLTLRSGQHYPPNFSGASIERADFSETALTGAFV